MTLPSDILRKHLSDKATHHSVAEKVYDVILPPLQDSATAILEIGIENGCSLRAWGEYFTRAQIWGIDNVASKLVNEYRIKSVLCDATERDKFLAIRDNMPMFDVIIDDGSHVIDLQIWAVAVLWPKLKPGGIFIVEDILYPQYLELFRCFPNAQLHDLRKVRGQYDDMVAVMRKPTASQPA